MRKLKLRRCHNTCKHVNDCATRACNARRRDLKLAEIVQSVLAEKLSIAVDEGSISKPGWFLGFDTKNSFVNLYVRHKHATM